MKLKGLKMASLLACTAGAMLSMPGAALANLVVNGDFAQPNLGGATFLTVNSGGTIGAWQVISGSVDLIGTGFWPDTTGQTVDMAGFNAHGQIQQTISTGPGLYHLTFDMAGNPQGDPGIKRLLVSLGGQTQLFTFDTTGHTTSSMGWTTMSWDVPVAIPNPILSFTDQSDSPSFGATLDNVSLEAAAVPEPTTCIAGALLLLPFGASTLRHLRRKQVA